MTPIVVRHGQTAWNVNERCRGREDIPLDDVGLSQAERTAERIGQAYPGEEIVVVGHTGRATARWQAGGADLAGTAVKDHHWVRRLRTLTVGFLTPFYFIRAGSLVALPALVSAPLVFLGLFAAKLVSKILGLFPVGAAFRRDRKERWYYTLMMSTGLTFGTISALYGLSHGIINGGQYSFLVAVVIASAVVPTLIAGAAFVPRHLLLGSARLRRSAADASGEEGLDSE